MNFTANKLKDVDYSKLEEGVSVASATLSSFNYNKDLCFGTFVSDGHSVRAIIGDKADHPVKEMLELKGIEVQITFGGTNVVAGKSYPKYWLSY